MSQFFPHPPYAEDQPLARTILTTHVLTRGFEAGTLVGAAIAVPFYVFRKPVAGLPRLFSRTLLRSSGVGAVIGTGVAAVMLIGRMWGREPIEWADRSWRLLENKGQVEVDNWGYGGALVGAAAASLPAAQAASLGWRGMAGSTGLGSLVGVGGYMVWRHGINGGKWEEDKSLSA